MSTFVGCGATFKIGSDSHPCTVVRIENNGGRLGVRLDRVYGRGVFSPAGVGGEPERWFDVRDDGSYCLEGHSFGRLELGERTYYRDPTFGPQLGERR